MPRKLSNLEVTEAVEEIFRCGVPSVRFLDLSEDDANEYKTIFELETDKYHSKVSGPLFSNDPNERNPRYSVTVINGRRRNQNA